MPTASLMAAQEIRAFAFEFDFADGLTYETEFTDDGDHVWRIDQNLHVQRVGLLAAGWRSHLPFGTRESLG